MWRLTRRRYNRTTLLALGCAAFLVGVVAGRKITVLQWWIVLPLVALGIAMLWRRTLLACVVVVVAGGLLGVWRGAAYFHSLQPYQTLAHQKIAFTATASSDAIYGTNGQLTFTVRDVTITEPYLQKVPGTLKVGGFGATMVYRGDKVMVQGSLYPTRGANQGSVGYAQLTLTSRGHSPIDTLRRKFAAGMQSALPEPLASFGLGLLVGQRNTLPEAVSETLLMVGLTHIIAVSGYNLTILLEASKRLLGKSSKLLSTLIALVLIAGFLVITGAGASIVRAAVISVLGLAAWYYGRSVRPITLILLAAAGTTYANPVYIWADISWYLSFLAFFGILVLGPIITHKLYGQKEPNMIVQVGLESICAEIMTLPIILYIFGQMSLVSLLANMLVVALIPLAMLLSFVAGLAGMLFGAVSGWFAWPAGMMLTYMLDVVQLLSRIPHVFQQNRYLSVTDMAMCYVAVAAVVWLTYMAQKRRQNWFFTAKTASETQQSTDKTQKYAYTR